MKFLRKNQKRNEKIKNTITEIKNAFDGLIRRLDKAEEKISGVGNVSIETSKTKTLKKKIKTFKKSMNCGIIIKSVKCVMKI